jgi:DNA-binding NarL/FixJ family response regulator
LTNKRTLLLIDNSTHHHGIFRDAIANAIDGPFEGEWVTTLAAAVERLKRNGIWAIFVNLSLPDSRRIETLDWLALAAGGIPTLVLAGVDERGLALEALRRGAKDYLLERTNSTEIRSFVPYAIWQSGRLPKKPCSSKRSVLKSPSIPLVTPS